MHQSFLTSASTSQMRKHPHNAMIQRPPRSRHQPPPAGIDVPGNCGDLMTRASDSMRRRARSSRPRRLAAYRHLLNSLNTFHENCGNRLADHWPAPARPKNLALTKPQSAERNTSGRTRAALRYRPHPGTNRE